MTKEQFKKWATDTANKLDSGRAGSMAFAKHIEQHDKQVAAALRKLNLVADELCETLKKSLVEKK